jgi:hypothetical protein
MSNVVKEILLGEEATVALLFSHPNIPGSKDSLSDTILHWFRQTLTNDLIADRATASVTIDGSKRYFLVLRGTDDVYEAFNLYADRLPKLLTYGFSALDEDIPAVKAAGLWDPKGDGWRFFLPLGLSMARGRSVQFFHYPPMKLLNPLRNYLDDPVPVRWEELLQANGVAARDTKLLETIVDAVPVAASDDQGSLISKMLEPKNYFSNYHLPLLRALTTQVGGGYTIPVIALGTPARNVFNALLSAKIGINVPALVKIVDNDRTAAVGANHPYYFYATAQGFDTVGSGKILPGSCAKAKDIMVADLVSAGWQARMAEDPRQDPSAVINTLTRFWNDPAQARMVCALTQRHGSLFYPGGDPSKFVFNLTLEQAMAYCDAHGQNPCAG